MQSKRFKNLLGALLGGFLGIQALGWTEKWWALALGVLMGASIGWYHNEIWQLATKLPKKSARVQESQSRRHLREAVRLSRRVGILVFVPLVSILLWQAALLLARLDYRETGGVWLLAGMVWIMSYMALACLFFISIYEALQGVTSIRGAYRFYETNKVRFVLMRLIKMSRYQFRTTIHVMALVLSIVPLAVLLAAVLASVLAVMGFKLFVNTTVFAVTRRDHLLCFTVTLLVTGLVGWASYDALSNLQIRWTVALGAGVLSGVVMELLRALEPTRFFKWVQNWKSTYGDKDPFAMQEWFTNILRKSINWLDRVTAPLKVVV